MAKGEIIDLINQEIERLQRAKDLLDGTGTLGLRRGRPISPETKHKIGGMMRKRRPMSAETKRKIGEMMRKRWAARKAKKK